MPALCILTVCFTQNNESAFRRHDVVYEHTKVKVCKQSVYVMETLSKSLEIQ